MTAPRQVFDLCVIAHVLEIFMGHNSSIAKSHHHNRKIDPREKVKIVAAATLGGSQTRAITSAPEDVVSAAAHRAV